MTLRVVRGWVWLYTIGLPLEMRNARRTEIDSDVWDHVHASGDAWSALLRCLRGVPADLLWRLADARKNRSSTEGQLAMQTFMIRSSLGLATIILMAVLVAAVLVAATIAFTVQYDGYYNDPTRGDTSVSIALWPWVILGVPLLGAGILATVSGLGLIRRAPWLGAVVLVSGVWVVATLFCWVQVPFAIAAIISFFAIGWAKRRTEIDTHEKAKNA